MPKPFLLKNSIGIIQFIAGVGWGEFSKGICRKVNIIARLEFELAYYEVAVQHVNP